MSAFVDSLNLRPQEKRIIVVIGVIVFVVLNFVFVFPQFKEKARTEAQLRATLQSNATEQVEIALDTNPANGLKKQLVKLQKQEGGDSGRFGGDIQLLKTVTDQARGAGMIVQNWDPVSTSHMGVTNAGSQFFESQSMALKAMSKEENLVKFLYNVGNDPAMIRVRELDLRPGDANRYELSCRITLTADYKKTASTKAVPAKLEAPLVPTAKIPTNTAPRAAARTNVPVKAPPPNALPPKPKTPPPMAGVPGQGARVIQNPALRGARGQTNR